MVKGTIPHFVEKPLGVILAGGRSSRMGADKALLPLRDRTLLQYQYDKLASVLGCENVVVSGRYPHLKHVVDLQEGIGPLGGIASVLKKYCNRNGFLFLPVDMPNLSEKSLVHLIQIAMTDPISNCWTYSGFELPIIIKNDKSFEAVLDDLLLQSKEHRSVHQLINFTQSRILSHEVPDREFLNTNTPNEWQEVANEHSSRF